MSGSLMPYLPLPHPHPATVGYLRITVSLRPVAHSEQQVAAALMAAHQEGRLAAALQAIGVQLAAGGASPTEEVISAATPGGSKASVGAAVGGSIGGVAVFGLAAAVFVVMRARRRHREELPITLPRPHREEEEPAQHKVRGWGAGRASHMT